ncbi:acyltransferase family protein [Pantoea septica]|uniref:acyltransferase family protein n=1 Tax=Pantoea septica TaxID=472695 RepID=UPI0028A16A31|nr:acyltransferase [Pantoea septica]
MSKKIIFADQLRVLAFLSVVIVHWFGTFWIERNLVSGAIYAPPVTSADPGWYTKLVPTFLPDFNFGPFGVAVFFLISGFVIPFSCRAKSAKGFIFSRALRIYPTYALSLLLTISAVYITSMLFWGETPNITWKTILANITLTQTLVMAPSIDLVNWTLAIEIKFYIACFLLRHLIVKNKFYPFVFLSIATFFINLHRQHFPGMLAMDMMFVTFMSIGVLFNYHFIGAMSTPRAYTYAIMQLFIFWKTLQISQIAPQTPVEIICVTYALILFTGCYLVRDRFKDIKILSFLSGISFPFYALHSVIGYCMLRLMVEHGVNYLAATAVAFIIIIMMATCVHHIIEKRSIAWGKWCK